MWMVYKIDIIYHMGRIKVEGGVWTILSVFSSLQFLCHFFKKKFFPTYTRYFFSYISSQSPLVERSVKVVSALTRGHQMPGVVVISVGDKGDLVRQLGGGRLIELYPFLLHLLGRLLNHLLCLLVWVAVRVVHLLEVIKVGLEIIPGW